MQVSSLGQAAIDFDDPMLNRSYDGVRAYSQSKLAQIIYATELAESIPAAELTVNSLHPATFMPTKIVLEERGAAVDTLELGTRVDAAPGARPGARRRLAAGSSTGSTRARPTRRRSTPRPARGCGR